MNPFENIDFPPCPTIEIVGLNAREQVSLQRLVSRWNILLYIATSFPNLGQSVFDTVFLRDPILGKRFHIFLFFQIKIGAALFLIVNSLVNG